MKTIVLLLLVPAVAHADDIAMPDDEVSTPAPEPVKPPAKWLEPYGAIAGGMRLESLHRAPGQSTGSQNPTVAVSRLGVRGGVGPHITFASEFEAALGGPLGYGASVWEGQAAIAIRDQFVRYARGGWSVAAGRSTHEACRSVAGSGQPTGASISEAARRPARRPVAGPGWATGRWPTVRG